MPAQLQRPVERFAQNGLHTHQHDTEERVQRQRCKHHRDLAELRNLPGSRVDADHHPVEQIAAEQEVHVHQQVRGVVAHRGIEKPAEIQAVETGDKEHRRDDRIREEP